jgi:glutathione synthase/RimK-type ligase-like ATP-grasp enzyme
VRAAIVTVEDDLHALAVKQALEERHGVDCAIVESDALADSGGLSWSEQHRSTAILPARDGGEVDVGGLDVIWWRRFNGDAKIPSDVSDPAAIDVITNDCRATLLGILLTEFHGAWVSHPDANRNAEIKLVQLRAARQAGFRVPQTLVSQHPEQIRQFCAALGNRVIVKALSGTKKAPLTTGIVNDELLASDRTLRLSPTIYQELVPGSAHLRVQGFGDEFHAVRINCEHLDWRFKLSESKVEPYVLPAAMQQRLRKVLRSLGLRMGIFDLKLAADGELVWLEVNPQGQFLFVEGLTGMPIIDLFADFLCSEAKQNRSARSRRACAAIPSI